MKHTKISRRASGRYGVVEARMQCALGTNSCPHVREQGTIQIQAAVIENVKWGCAGGDATAPARLRTGVRRRHVENGMQECPVDEALSIVAQVAGKCCVCREREDVVCTQPCVGRRHRPRNDQEVVGREARWRTLSVICEVAKRKQRRLLVTASRVRHVPGRGTADERHACSFMIMSG